MEREMEQLESDLHDFRKDIDGCIQVAKFYKSLSGQETPDRRILFQREIDLVYTKLQEAKMWVGKCLEMIGSELPAQYRDKAE